MLDLSTRVLGEYLSLQKTLKWWEIAKLFLVIAVGLSLISYLLIEGWQTFSVVFAFFVFIFFAVMGIVMVKEINNKQPVTDRFTSVKTALNVGNLAIVVCNDTRMMRIATALFRRLHDVSVRPFGRRGSVDQNPFLVVHTDNVCTAPTIEEAKKVGGGINKLYLILFPNTSLIDDGSKISSVRATLCDSGGKGVLAVHFGDGSIKASVLDSDRLSDEKIVSELVEGIVGEIFDRIYVSVRATNPPQ